MPIRFRCVYCDKLLGIARRKAGAVVNCPQCHQPLIVPTPEPQPSTAAASASAAPVSAGAASAAEGSGGHKLFERDDFESLLDPGHTESDAPDPPSKSKYKPRRSNVETSSGEADGPRYQAPRPLGEGVLVSKRQLVVAGLGVALLMVAAFVAGFAVCKMIST